MTSTAKRKTAKEWRDELAIAFRAMRSYERLGYELRAPCVTTGAFRWLRRAAAC